MTRSVQGKSAIVTGAGSGIDLEFSRLLLKAGANVLFADLALRPEAQQLVDEHQKHDGPRAVFQKTDVTSWSDLTNMFGVAEREFGAIDIVCPGAGVFEPPFSGFWYPPGQPPSVDDPLGDRYKSMDINLTHPIRVTQMAISHFLASSPPPGQDNRKTIVHISSIAGENAHLSHPLYTAAKWGLRGFVYSLAALEASHGIRVGGVCPAVVKTPLWLDHEDKRRTVTSNGKIQDDWVTAEEVAELMFKLVIDDEVVAGATGENIPIKGGSMIEVNAGNLKDVPIFGNTPPGSAGGKGMLVVNIAEMYDVAKTNMEKPGWGKF